MARPDPDRFRKWGELAGIGPMFAAAVLVGYFGGSFLDARLHTAPWIMVAGVLLGTVAAFIELIRLLQRLGEMGKKGGRRRPGAGEGGGES